MRRIEDKIVTLQKLPSTASLGRIGVCTGCYDIVHSGHGVFFEQCKQFCDTLFVVVGRSSVVAQQKPGRPLNPENNRLFLVAALEAVDYVVLGDEKLLPGKIDCYSFCDRLHPDVYILNEDDSGLAAKQAFCHDRGIGLQLVPRTVPELLTPTSTTELVRKLGANSQEDFYFPYRICLTGGWLDQPWVSQVHAGAVSVLNLEPTREYSFRSGMATSTRETARGIWPTFPEGNPEEIARILFGAENPPGKSPISGSQDALGLCLPGFNALHYAGGYWPERIESHCSPDLAAWFEKVLHLVPIRSRPDGYDPLTEKNLRPEPVSHLAQSTDMAVQAAKHRDAGLLGKALRQTVEAWRIMLPNTVPANVYEEVLATDGKCRGCGLSGCGGGYLLVVADKRPSNGLAIRVRTGKTR